MKNLTQLTSEIAYEIFKNRDRRFDGLIFVGVTSTGIYCRPICPAPPAKFENCQFYNSVALAEKDGFRPCLRCKPERSPHAYNSENLSDLVYRSIQKIEQALDKDWNLEDLANSLNVSSRHLRRCFVEDLGVTPVQFLRSIRLLRAKQLLSDTSLSLTEVAFASGFKSVRTFNETIKKQYKLKPSDMRKQQRGETSPEKIIELKCGFRTPYDWASVLGYLKGRSNHAAELVKDGVYYRTVELEAHRGWLSVELNKKDQHLVISISYSLHPVVSEVIARIKRQFDIHANPMLINEVLGKSPILKESVAANPGLRSPGSFDAFEMLVRVILGQLISVKAATTLMNRFVEAYGQPIATPVAELNRVSPTAKTIATVDRDQLAGLGMQRKKAQTIIEVAKLFVSGELDFSLSTDKEALKKRLIQTAGIGAWTVEYMLMRGVSWPDAFPSTDLGVQKALGTKSKKEIEQIGLDWSPFRAYATQHLWRMIS